MYFDGSSAAKTHDSHMDTQDIVAWGELQLDNFHSERERIKTLCDWGRECGLDGFVEWSFICACTLSFTAPPPSGSNRTIAAR